jgi:hypothetical protein
LDRLTASENRFNGVDGTGKGQVPVKDLRATTNERAGAREIGSLLIVSGIAGMIIPGPVGTPLLILGCVMFWPRAFAPIQRFFQKQFPRTHRVGALQSARFLSDLQRRYPASR